MGVFGLWSFMQEHSSLITKYYLHDTKLVIDADDLYYFISKDMLDKYSDYHLLADKIKDFLKLLKMCNISPYFVFNGGRESDTKLDINIENAKRTIDGVREIIKGRNGSLMPELGLETFKHIIAEMRIPFVAGDFDADNSIAKLANEWKCPVLSRDADFFIFSLEGGLVILDRLDFPIESIRDERTIVCKFYHFRNFMKVFPGLDMNMLPLLDGVCKRTDGGRHNLFENFRNKLKQAPKDFGGQIISRKKFAPTLSLLYWLKNESSVSDAMKHVTRFIEEKEREKACKIMQDSMNFYRKSEFSFRMEKFFETNQLEFSANAAKILKKDGNPLLRWFLEALKRDNVPKFCLDVLNQQSLLFYSQIENLEWESSHECSRHIRQVIYGILILHDMDKLPASKQSVKEYDRNGRNFEERVVEPIFELDKFGPLPALNDISTASLDVRKQVFLSALGVSMQFLETFPIELKLVAATIVYWVKKSSPEIKKLMVSSLVACILYLWAKEFRQHSPQQKASMQTSVTNPSSLVKLMLDCEKNDLDLVGKNLIKMCGIPSTDYRKKIDIAIVHSFSQFQSCLRYAVYLNSLLLKPFVATSPHLIYCGTFLDNIFHDSHQRTNPQKHIADAFGTDSVLRNLFVTMDEAFHSVLETCYQVEE